MSNNRLPLDRFGIPFSEEEFKRMKRFFYARPIRSVTYSWIPGRKIKINPSRLIQNLPPFEHESISYKYEMKKIFINDWLLPFLGGNWQEHNLTNLKARFFRFHLFVWDGKEIIKTNLTDLDTLIYSFKFISNEKLLGLVGIPREQVFIFDNQESSCLDSCLDDSLGFLNSSINLTLDKDFVINDSLQDQKTFPHPTHLWLQDLFFTKGNPSEPVNEENPRCKTFFLRKLFFIPEQYIETILNELDESSYDTLDLSLCSHGHGLCHPDKIKHIIKIVSKKFDKIEHITMSSSLCYLFIDSVHLELIAHVKKIDIEDDKFEEVGKLTEFLKQHGRENVRINLINYEDINCFNVPYSSSKKGFYLGMNNHFYRLANEIEKYRTENPIAIDLTDNVETICNILLHCNWISSIRYSSEEVKNHNFPINPHITEFVLNNYQVQTVKSLLTSLPNLSALILNSASEDFFDMMPDTILKKLKNYYQGEGELGLQQLVQRLKRLPSLIKLELTIYLDCHLDNKFFNNLETLCPELKSITLNLTVSNYNENALLHFIRLLPKNLKHFVMYLDITCEKNISQAIYNEIKATHVISAKRINDAIESHFTHLTKHKTIIGSEDLEDKITSSNISKNRVQSLDVKTDKESSTKPLKFFVCNAIARHTFEHRRSRHSFLTMDENLNTKLIKLNPSLFKDIHFVKRYKPSEIRPAFDALEQSELPLIYLIDKVKIKPGELIPLLSPGPNDFIYKDREGYDCIAFDYSVKTLRSDTNNLGIYAIQLLPDDKEEREISFALIYRHFPEQYPLHPIYNSKETLAFTHLKFKDNGKLDFTSIGSPIALDEDTLLPQHRLISASIRYCQGFRKGQLESSNQNKLTKLWQQRKGLCRHRARLLYWFLKNVGLEDRVRLVQDPCGAHEWVEIKYTDKNIKDHINHNDYDSGDDKEAPIEKWLPIELRKEMEFVNENKLNSDIEEMNEDKDVEMEIKNEIKSKNPNDMKVDLLETNPNIVEQLQKLIPQLPTQTPNDFFTAIDEKFTSPTTAKQCLVSVPTDEDRFNFYYYLKQRQLGRKRKLCVIDNLENNYSKTLHIDEKGNETIVPTEPHQLLLTAKPGDALVLNIIDMKPQHVGYNSVVDAYKRMLDQTPIPTGVEVFVVTDEDNFQELRQDVKSRFQRTKGLIAHLPAWKKQEIPITDSKDAFVIDMTGKDFETYLFGQYSIKDKQKNIQKGILICELINKPILFINQPNHAEFKTFLNTQTYFFNGKLYSFDQPFFSVNRQLEFNVRSLLKDSKEQTTEWFLTEPNLSCLNSNKSGIPSIIDVLPNGSTLWILDTLKEEDWFIFLNLCQEKNKNFVFKTTPNVQVPKKLEKCVTSSLLTFSNSLCEVVLTSDVSKMSAYYFLQDKNNSVIFSSNHQMSFELLERHTVQRVEHERPIVGHQLGDLIAQLDLGKRVILKANQLSREMQNALAGLFMNPPFIMFKNEKYFIKAGKLIILSESNEDFSYLNKSNEVKKEPDSWQLLQSLFNQTASDVIHFKKEFDDLKLEKEPSFEVLTHLFRSYRLNGPASLHIYKNFLANKSDALPPLYYNDRLAILVKLIKEKRTLFLAGPSGTGKSSTVLFDLPKKLSAELKCEVNLFVGLNKLEEWSKPPVKDQIKILFNDEANLVPDIDRLNGINDPLDPHLILNNGERIPLSSQNKVIFAGNLGYEGRQNHPLFESSDIVFFQELTFKEKFDQFVLPILLKNNNLNADDLSVIYSIFEKADQQVKTTSKAKLITTRNLENMALHFLQFSKTQSTQNAASLAAQTSIRYLLPDYTLQSISEPNDQLKTKLMSQQFLPTPTHKPTLNALECMMSLRNLTSLDPNLQNKGTRGVLLEGPSGIAKSNAAEKYLTSCGFKEVKLSNPSNIMNSNCYCILKASSPDKMLEVLHRAFHEGWIVIIDEIDSLVLEEYLNAFMSGVDLEGNKARKPGFCVIGTMNGLKLPNRLELSPAFKNRFTHVELNQYTLEEVLQIIHFIFPNLTQDKRQLLAQCYMLSQTTKDPLAIRDIIDIANENLNQEQFRFIQSFVTPIQDSRDSKDASSQTENSMGLAPMSDVDDVLCSIKKAQSSVSTISLFAKQSVSELPVFQHPADEKNSFRLFSPQPVNNQSDNIAIVHGAVNDEPTREPMSDEVSPASVGLSGSSGSSGFSGFSGSSGFSASGSSASSGSAGSPSLDKKRKAMNDHPEGQGQISKKTKCRSS